MNPNSSQTIISVMLSVEIESGSPKKTRGKEVNSSQMISPGSDCPVIFSA